MSSLRLLTLNIEGHKHLDRWLPVVQKLKPDVVCLQEVFAADLPQIEAALGMSAVFEPMSDIRVVNEYKIHPLGHWGVAQLTNLPTRKQHTQQYGGENILPVFHRPNDSQRIVLLQEINKVGLWYPIATTHFTWSKGGELSQLQLEDFGRLAQIIRTFDKLVLCGDFNAPRGGQLFGLFESLLTDHVPQEVATTIDPDLHYAGDLQLVVDTIFATSEITLDNVKIISGVSDHMGVVGEARWL